MNNGNRFNELFHKAFPWGMAYASREHFERGYTKKEEEFVERYFPETSSNILVIASGNGREARPIADERHKIICVDCCFTYLQSAQALFGSEKTEGVFFVQANAESLPFSDGSFDFVFFSIYSVLKDKRFTVMRRLLRMLRSGGAILVGTSMPSHCARKPGNGGCKVFRDEEEFRDDLQFCGCEVLEVGFDSNRPRYPKAVVRDRSRIQ